MRVKDFYYLCTSALRMPLKSKKMTETPSPESPFYVRILGCGSAKPSLRHNPSSQALVYHGRVFLIDCGEGTQLQMARFGVSPQKVTDIFISHLHGDHFLGLPGLLATMTLHGRTEPVRVHTTEEGAALLRHILGVLSPVGSDIVEYCVYDASQGARVYEDAALTVDTVPLHHRVPCCGFIFREKPKARHIRPEAIGTYGIPYDKIREIREGADFIRADGTAVANETLTLPPSPSMSYAYCSDTAYGSDVAEAVRGVTVLYHEATYGDSCAAKAEARGHSTARQAGVVAREAGAKVLIIGHYSQAIRDEKALAAEAQEEFQGPVILADEGLTVNVGAL